MAQRAPYAPCHPASFFLSLRRRDAHHQRDPPTFTRHFLPAALNRERRRAARILTGGKKRKLREARERERERAHRVRGNADDSSEKVERRQEGKGTHREGRWGEEEEGGTEESTARGTLGSNSRPREDYLPWQASGGGCTPR